MALVCQLTGHTPLVYPIYSHPNNTRAFILLCYCNSQPLTFFYLNLEMGTVLLIVDFCPYLLN